MQLPSITSGYLAVLALLYAAHDPEKARPALDAGWVPVFPRDKRGTRLRGDHAQTIS